ncbi:hypothetical protein [Mucilaginibacter sp.]|uniref:hypothetical protein n=1 Tax=Mucilaginibacter sp. TaxID=1882438 RepID=UPI0025EF0B5F|nr:hypothetical protein [Mucilaginibacter sp.]
MELDELKSAWERQKENTKAANFELMPPLQQRSLGPVAALQRNFRKKFLVLLMVSTSLGIQNIFQFGNDVLMWVFIICCYAIAAYYWHRLSLLNELQTLHRPVRAHFEALVGVLEKGIRWHAAALQAMALLFVILLEIHPEPLFADWYQQPVALRIICYGVFLVAIYLLKQFSLERSFSQHINHIKQVLAQFS